MILIKVVFRFSSAWPLNAMCTERSKDIVLCVNITDTAQTFHCCYFPRFSLLSSSFRFLLCPKCSLNVILEIYATLCLKT
jgi:hypothetical protein